MKNGHVHIFVNQGESQGTMFIFFEQSQIQIRFAFVKLPFSKKLNVSFIYTYKPAANIELIQTTNTTNNPFFSNQEKKFVRQNMNM